LARSARPGEYWRTTPESFHPPGEHQRGSASISLLVTRSRSVTAQEHTRSLGLAARLAQRPCIS
ncbi:hypothetical protein A2U01_0117941, partial [Trifolium medium]|nr:hypothetical protein [Trifolium medium]